MYLNEMVAVWAYPDCLPSVFGEVMRQSSSV